MNNKKSMHSFHIPVMGLAYTIDSPIRVAQYGISSVISIIDDEIIEKMNRLYHQRNNFSYTEISNKVEDYRAKRITAYLDMVHEVVHQKFITFKQELSKSKEALQQFIDMLPNQSDIKKGLESFSEQKENFTENVLKFLENHLSPGSIDVNVMTKVDKDNFVNGAQLPVIYNDAHVSLRGFANSKLSSSIVLSAGMNPRLYSYFESFPDFFPNEKGELKKKIILKVSDFRSAMIQGNFLAKKGLWVSEYRIESGLNCGGHAFATDGFLLGPILQEFKEKKEQLSRSAHELLVKALNQKEMFTPEKPMELKITAQGGVGTAEEHEFLLEQYNLDAIGWGSPFLLVPEATSMDNETRTLLANAKEDDFYLSTISPLRVPFNSVRGTSNEFWKQKRIDENNAGSSCPKRLLALSKEHDEKGMCTASKKYQDIKLEELNNKKDTISISEFEKMKTKITDKSCLCVGLVNAAYLENDIKIKGQQQGIVICPGPNLAYFNKEISLANMVKHIYGNANVMTDENRPNVFVKELKMYVDYLRNEISEYTNELSAGQIKKWNLFKTNLLAGIEYYEDLFSSTNFFKEERSKIKNQIEKYKSELIEIEIPSLVLT